MNLDDVVSGQVQVLESLKVPENGLWDGGEGIPCQIQSLQGQCQGPEVGAVQIGNAVIWKKRVNCKYITYFTFIHIFKICGKSNMLEQLEKFPANGLTNDFPSNSKVKVKFITKTLR